MAQRVPIDSWYRLASTLGVSAIVGAWATELSAHSARRCGVTLEDLGNIGEFVSALAVVLSLIYVAIQIRQNTRHVRAANYQQILVASVEFRRDLALNPAAAALMEHAREHDDVPMEGRPQFHQLAVGLLRLYENLHYQYRKGLIDPDLWPAWVSTIDGFLRMTPARESYLRERGIFDSHFCDYVDDRIRELEVGAVQHGAEA